MQMIINQQDHFSPSFLAQWLKGIFLLAVSIGTLGSREYGIFFFRTKCPKYHIVNRPGKLSQ